MQARAFRGGTLLEAVRAARAALGPDALVLAARRIEERRWLRRSRTLGFEITVGVLATGRGPDEDDAARAEIRRLGVRLDSLVAQWAQGDRLAEELRALRHAVVALGERLPPAPAAPETGRRPERHVRIAGAPQPEPTPSSVERRR